MSTGEVVSLSRVVGRNLKRLRLAAGATQDVVAAEMTTLGFGWAGPRVAQVEAGGATPDLRMLLALAAVLDYLTRHPRKVTVADLLVAGEPVELTTGWSVPSQRLIGVLRGGAAQSLVGDGSPPLVPPGKPKPLPKPDQRVARELGLSAQAMRDVTGVLWQGRTLTEERDRRLAAGELPEPASGNPRLDAARVTAHLREILRRNLA